MAIKRQWFGGLTRTMICVLSGLLVVGSAAASSKTTPGPATTLRPDVPPAELKIANRYICTLRGVSFGASPAERARIIQSGVAVLLERGRPLEVTTEQFPSAVHVMVDGSPLFRILDEDVDAALGETPAMVAEAAADNLRHALDELQEARDSRSLLRALGYSALATLLLVVVLGLLARIYRKWVPRLRAVLERRTEAVASRLSHQVVSHTHVGGFVTVAARLVAVLVIAVLVYEWLAFVLQSFPYTRPWGEALLGNSLGIIQRIGAALMGALPGLVFVVVIMAIARLVTRIIRAFFESVAQGRVSLAWVDESTARPTARLANAAVWLFAFVAAYPYIPGSDSEAFKGIGVFVGLMVSIGSSGIVNQAVSGLMLMYTRALRPGEFVKIGETEGIVTSVGFVTTRIETLRREELNVPNAIIASSVTRNYSRLAKDGGVFVPTTVTIGYDTPWRQVHAMLLLAAERTEGVAKTPAPRVLQTGLMDFYAEYTLLVNIAEPVRRLAILSELNSKVQDVFNEFGVQIMSPHYESDPADAKIVPREGWSPSPAND
jgi:small-conductance mechanosensitive channel